MIRYLRWEQSRLASAVGADLPHRGPVSGTVLWWMRRLLVALIVLAPAVGASAQTALPPPEGEVLLRVSGNIAQANVGSEAHFDRAMIEALPRHVLRTTSVVADGVRRFEGFLMRDLLNAVGARGETLTATALNDYVIDIPVSDFTSFDVLVAYRMDGERLTARDKGPLWIVYPRDDHAELQDIRYDYRWVWQLIHIDVR